MNRRSFISRVAALFGGAVAAKYLPDQSDDAPTPDIFDSVPEVCDPPKRFGIPDSPGCNLIPSSWTQSRYRTIATGHPIQAGQMVVIDERGEAVPWVLDPDRAIFGRAMTRRYTDDGLLVVDVEVWP